MTPFSDDPDFLDLIAVWHENREFSDGRKAELLERLGSDSELRRELAREVQMAALRDRATIDLNSTKYTYYRPTYRFHPDARAGN